MPEAVIVATARSPIGRAFKGSLTIDPAGRPHRADGHPRRWPRSRSSSPDDIDDLMLGCGLPGGEQGFNMAPRGRHPARLRQPARHHGHQVLLVLAADHPDGVPRHQGRRGRRVHLGRRGVREPVRQRQQRQLARHAQPGLRGRRGPVRGARGGRRPGLARPARGRHDPGRLHRDGPDRGERRRSCAGSSARPRTSSASGRRTWPRRRSPTASGSATSPRSRSRTGPW